MKTINLPANIFESKAIVALSAEFGHAAQIAIVMILCEIAKSGYFIPWNNLQKNFMARNIDIEPDVLDRIVKRLVEYEYFDAEMFAKDKVLTSLNLQKRYFRSKKRREQIPSLPYILSQINEKYHSTTTVATTPAGTCGSRVHPLNLEKHVVDEKELTAAAETVCENSVNTANVELPVVSDQKVPSKTKVIRYLSGIVKADAKTVRERALEFYEQAKASKWRFTDPDTRQLLTWQQAIERTRPEMRAAGI